MPGSAAALRRRPFANPFTSPNRSTTLKVHEGPIPDGLKSYVRPLGLFQKSEAYDMSKKKVLVAGGGGFIGGHLTARLLKDGFQVRCVDVKPIDAWYQVFDEAENLVAELR